MTLEEREGELRITFLPVEQMALLSLGLALTGEERRVLSALLEGKRVYLPQEALEYKRYAKTAERGLYIRLTAMERELREMGLRRGAGSGGRGGGP